MFRSLNFPPALGECLMLSGNFGNFLFYLFYKLNKTNFSHFREISSVVNVCTIQKSFYSTDTTLNFQPYKTKQPILY